MKDTQTQFIRKYKRVSKSPWGDESTILLLAGVNSEDGVTLDLDFGEVNYTRLTFTFKI